MMSKNTNYFVVLSETKDSKDKILGSYYPWVFTVSHGYSPMGTRLLEVPEILEILEIGRNRKIWVLCKMYGSTEYQLFPTIIPSYLAQKHAFLHSFLLNIIY